MEADSPPERYVSDMTESVPERPSPEPHVETEPFVSKLTLAGWTAPATPGGRPQPYLCIAARECVEDVQILMPLYAEQLGIDPAGVVHDAGSQLSIAVLDGKIAVMDADRMVLGTHGKCPRWVEAAKFTGYVHLAVGFSCIGSSELIREYAARVVSVGDCAMTTVPVRPD